MKRLIGALLFLFVLINLSGCGYWNYQTTDAGRFEGKLEVRWERPNQFLFLPHPDDPLRFTRLKDGRVIQPKAMYTDGGTIPQFIWSVPGYSPWGYAPAYIIHDWIFAAHHCSDSDDGDFTFDESAEILSEGIKTLMEQNDIERSYFTHYTISQAVKGKIAEGYWNSNKYSEKGLCAVQREKALDTSIPIIVIDASDLNKLIKE